MVARSLELLLAAVRSLRKAVFAMSLASRRNRRPAVCPECPSVPPLVPPLNVLGLSASVGDDFVIIDVDGTLAAAANDISSLPARCTVRSNGVDLIFAGQIVYGASQWLYEGTLPLAAGPLELIVPPNYFGVVSDVGGFVAPGTFNGVCT